MSNIKVLVTGGEGYIGSHVVKMIGERGYSVLTYDKLSYGYRDSILHGELLVARTNKLNCVTSIPSVCDGVASSVTTSPFFRHCEPKAKQSLRLLRHFVPRNDKEKNAMKRKKT